MGEPSQLGDPQPVASYPDAARPLLAAEQLAKRFATSVAIDALSFAVHRGERVVVAGHPGAGKSTLLRLLAGVLRPSGGRALVGGRDVNGGSAATGRLGYLPAQAPAYPDMPAHAFLFYIAGLRGVPRQRRRQRCEEAAAACGLSCALDQAVGALSAVFRRRLGLAQAIVHLPDALLVDEPTAGLDAEGAAAIATLIGELGRGRAVLVASGAPASLGSLPSRLLVLSEGALVADHPAGAPLPAHGDLELRLVLQPRAGSGVASERLARLLRHLPGVVQVDCEVPAAAVGAAFRLRVEEAHDVGEAIAAAATANHLVVRQLSRQGAAPLQALPARHPTSALFAAASQPSAAPAAPGAHHV